MLIEIHMLQNHVPSNLNRDDSGSPKDCVFGGVRRARISSQCLKRSIRQSEMFKSKLPTMGLRTRKMPVEVKNKLIKDGIPEDIAELCGKIAAGIGSNADKAAEKLETKQIMFFSEEEMNEIANILKKLIAGKSPDDIAKIKPSDIEKKMKSNPNLNITPDIALFGRMVTSDMFRNIEASIQVAHAISTHKMDHEFDYFTAVDDLSDKFEGMKEQGSAMIGEVEFTSACYYKYFAIDSDGFIANMTYGKKDANATTTAKSVFIDVLTGFIKGAVFANPSGKQNTFAAHQLPDAILIEIKEDKIPVSYANAFLDPVTATPKEDLMTASINKFKKQVEETVKIFKINSKYKLWLNTKNIDIQGTQKVADIDQLIATIEDKLKKDL